MLELRLLGTMGRNSLSCSRRRSAGNVVFEEKYTMEEISKLANVKSGFGVNLDDSRRERIHERRSIRDIYKIASRFARTGMHEADIQDSTSSLHDLRRGRRAGGSTFRNTLSHYPQVRLGGISDSPFEICFVFRRKRLVCLW